MTSHESKSKKVEIATLEVKSVLPTTFDLTQVVFNSLNRNIATSDSSPRGFQVTKRHQQFFFGNKYQKQSPKTFRNNGYFWRFCSLEAIPLI